MCETTDHLQTLLRIPFAVASLANTFTQGSYERELTERVYQAIRNDIDHAVAQWEAERKRNN